MTTGYATETALVDAAWAQAHLTTRTSASSRSTSTRPRTSRATCRARSAGTGRASCRTGSAATSRRARTSARSSRLGIGPDTTIVLYGDNNNWFAAWAYWQLKLYGHHDVRILDGGRKYWLDQGLPLSIDVPTYPATGYELPEPDFALRAFRDDILPRLGDPELALVDVRSPAEFNGEIIAPPGMSETAQRAGHIPGAASIPWAQTVREDGTSSPPTSSRRCTRPRA